KSTSALPRSASRDQRSRDRLVRARPRASTLRRTARTPETIYGSRCPLLPKRLVERHRGEVLLAADEETIAPVEPEHVDAVVWAPVEGREVAARLDEGSRSSDDDAQAHVDELDCAHELEDAADVAEELLLADEDRVGLLIPGGRDRMGERHVRVEHVR